jgi:hypothetical protein
VGVDHVGIEVECNGGLQDLPLESLFHPLAMFGQKHPATEPIPRRTGPLVGPLRVRRFSKPDESDVAVAGDTRGKADESDPMTG